MPKGLQVSIHGLSASLEVSDEAQLRQLQSCQCAGFRYWRLISNLEVLEPSHKLHGLRDQHSDLCGQRSCICILETVRAHKPVTRTLHGIDASAALA